MAKQGLGFVGTGRMGSRMVRRLIQAGHEVTIYDTSEVAVAPLVEIGAKRAASPAAVASAAEIVFASVPTPPILQAVALGPNGIIEGRRVKIFVDVSTTGATVEKLVAEGIGCQGHHGRGCAG